MANRWLTAYTAHAAKTDTAVVLLKWRDREVPGGSFSRKYAADLPAGSTLANARAGRLEAVLRPIDLHPKKRHNQTNPNSFVAH